MGEHKVQCGVVLHQRVVLIVPNELHHRSECQGVGEAILPITLVNLDQLVVPVFPENVKRWIAQLKSSCQTKTQILLMIVVVVLLSLDHVAAYLNVSVKSPCSFVDASRTRNEPSGVSRSFSFTSSLKGKQLKVNQSNFSNALNNQTYSMTACLNGRYFTWLCLPNTIQRPAACM